MNKNYFCVIMAGGAGTRFWPMSRNAKPKQFIDILGTGESLLQQTFRRFLKVCSKDQIYVATNDIYKDIVKEQLPEIADEQIICEPRRRNTAPCIAYANYKIYKKNPNATIIVAPSDHIITKEDAFNDVVNSAMEQASKNDWLITLGIKPHHPNTGYGYIQFDENIMCAADNRIRKVKTFTEKPNLEMAKSFLESGDFLWNAGIFIWSLQSSMNAFKQFLPDIDDLFAGGLDLYNTDKEMHFIEKTYPMSRSISIDYGIMEKAQNVYVLSADLGWSDLGTWGSLYNSLDKDSDGNALIGNNVMPYDLKNCIIRIPEDILVVAQGLEDYIVVGDKKVLLICKKSEEQMIRQFVSDSEAKTGQKYI